MRTNPPNALTRAVTTLPGILNVSDPTLGFVFVPGPQTTRHSITIAGREPRDAVHAPVEPELRTEAAVELEPAGDLQRQPRASSTLNGTRSTTCRCRRSTVRYSSSIIRTTRRRPGFPDLRGKMIDRIAADVQCAGTGLPDIAVNAACPVPVPIADNEISSRVPRTNERRPDPRYTTNLWVSNDAESWYDGHSDRVAEAAQQGPAFPASYTRSKSRRHDVGSDVRRRRRHESAGPELALYARGYSRFHTPHRFTFNGSYLLPFWQRPARPDRDAARRMAGLGARSSWRPARRSR